MIHILFNTAITGAICELATICDAAERDGDGRDEADDAYYDRIYDLSVYETAEGIV